MTATDAIVVVGSDNPVKVNAVERAFKRVFPDTTLTMRFHKVASNVRDQPWGDEETRLGAENRSKAALVAEPTADYAVGLEGGLISMPDGRLMCFAWMVVLDRESGKLGEAKTAAFFLPSEVTRLVIDKKLELGEADDQVFNRSDSKRSNGSIGILTGDLIDRCNYYEQALILAFIPFLPINSSLTW